jgi:hypothetical protein
LGRSERPKYCKCKKNLMFLCYYVVLSCYHPAPVDRLMLVVKQHTSVFKKRPNFLNSAPTSIESAPRLLSAPSVRFWKQTAIYPVSLWAQVVELHPLNWARAQSVRRIRGKVAMKQPEEQSVCVCVNVYCKLGKNFIQTFQLLNQAYARCAQ